MTYTVHLPPDWQPAANLFLCRVHIHRPFSSSLAPSYTPHTWHPGSAFVCYCEETSFVWEQAAGRESKGSIQTGECGEIRHQGADNQATLAAPIDQPAVWGINSTSHHIGVRERDGMERWYDSDWRFRVSCSHGTGLIGSVVHTQRWI